ncbi:MAG TPA: AAA family ATPase [Streptosporangiaceae bacterium]|nr:AAA family ATPase [Streptosporangiaceae bacterium]
MLLERADELRALDIVLDVGGVLVIEGGAGIGKTSLLRLGSERAARSGWRVLRGSGSELETGFAFGVVRQLFERELAAAEPTRRAQWLAGPAAAVRGLLGAPDAAPDPFAVVHGLYWLTVNMAAGQPVLIAVDDAHWADPASLRWLAYLASRVEGAGVAVVVALRPAEPASRQGPLAKIRTAAPVIRPALLSAAGVAAIVRAALGAGTPDATCQALREASGGNPFYLGELLRAQSAADPGGGRLPASEAVARHVEARIRRLDPAALGLAQALAVLGDEAQLRHAMAMTGLDTDPAVRLAAALVRVEVLAAANPPRFLHPVVRAAVDASLGSDERDRMHRAAARELDRDDAAPGRVAAHLMHVQPAGDAWVAGRLRQAARSSLAAGAPAEAGDQLRRAFAEPPPPPERTGVLRELAAADASAGRQSAAGWLAEALARTSDPRERAGIAHELARTYAALFRWVEAVDTTDRALAELGDRDPALAARLEAELAVAGMHDARRAARVVAVMERLRARRSSPDPETAEALAVARAMAGVLTGQLTAEAAGSLDDALRAAEPAAPNWDTRAALLWTMITAERFHQVDGALPAMAEAATRAGSARGLIAVYSSLGFCKLRLGALPEADGAARVALRILQEGDFTAGLGVAAIVAEVAIEAGELDEARALLELIPPGPAGVLTVLAPAAAGRLSLARGDGQQALTCFQACLAMFGADVWGIEIRDVGYLHARSGAAQAWLLLGHRDQARTLAEAELADARISGGPRALGIALRVAGLAAGGADGLDLLSESVDVLRGSPALLERAKSIAELGAALRRAGQRVAARPLLAEALDLAAGCGARPLASRLRTELAAAGGRPRRERRHGLDALTPSELRVARLAADGQTNRQIAHGLYVTLKTVETHLAHVYAKLGISHRGELPAALAGENLGVPTPTRTAGR